MRGWRERLDGTTIFTLVVLVLPWLWLAWCTRPGAARPSVVEAVSPFLIAHTLCAQWGAEWAVEKREPAYAITGLGLALVNSALIAWRIHEAGVFVIQAGILLLVAAATALLIRFGGHREAV